MAVVSHVRTMLTDPGCVPKGNATDDNIQRLGLAAGQVLLQDFEQCEESRFPYRLSTSAPSARQSSPKEHITVACARDVYVRWIITVRG